MSVFDIDADGVVLFESTAERDAREARTEWNALVPVARLPPEILAAVFVRCIPTSVFKLKNDLSWLNITRVSRAWRDIALACPDFWSTLVFHRPMWTPVMLERSKMASLIIRLNLKKEHTVPDCILLDHASRLGILEIRSPQPQLEAFFATLEHAGAAPRLECVKVVNTSKNNLEEGGTWLPSNIFRRSEVLESRKNGAQLGVQLHLESCAFPWDSGWFIGLTDLHLEKINLVQRPTMETFLGILAGCPNLRALTMIHCPPTTLRGFVVELAHLNTLTLQSDSPIASLRLLGYLVFPSSAILNITLRGNYDQHQKTYKSLLTIFCRAPPELYDTLWFEQTATHFSCTITHSEHREWSRTVGIFGALPYVDGIHLIELVRDHLDISNVNTLHLMGMDSLPPPPLYDVYEDVALNSTLLLWDTLGRSLHNVHTIHLHQTFPALWLEFLLTQAMLIIGVSHHNSCFNIPMPPLRTVKYGLPLPLRDADGTLRHAWAGMRRLFLHGVDLESMPSDHPPTCLSRLLALFWARRTGGAPIWGLTLEGCRNVSWYRLANFRLFADVNCEGRSEEDWENTGVEDLVCIRSYSINIFAEVAEVVRKPRHED